MDETTATVSDEVKGEYTITVSRSARVQHIIRERMIRTGQASIQTERETQKIILEAVVTTGIDYIAPMKLEILDNAIVQGD